MSSSSCLNQYRLDDRGRLFDILADPAQQSPIGDRQPEVASRLREAVAAWRKEVLAEATPGPSPKAFVGNAVDPRPIPVGYRDFPITMLPARDGEPQGGVKRSSPAPNCSYFVNWTSTDDRMVWNLDVKTAGVYDVVIDYTCPEADAGSTIELSFSDSLVRGEVGSGWDPPLYTNQDTLPRPHGESQMKEFKSLRLGKIRLAKGEGALTLRAVEIPGKSVMDVRRVTLTLVD